MKEIGLNYDSMNNYLPDHILKHIRQHMNHVRQTLVDQDKH